MSGNAEPHNTASTTTSSHNEESPSSNIPGYDWFEYFDSLEEAGYDEFVHSDGAFRLWLKGIA